MCTQLKIVVLRGLGVADLDAIPLGSSYEAFEKKAAAIAGCNQSELHIASGSRFSPTYVVKLDPMAYKTLTEMTPGRLAAHYICGHVQVDRDSFIRVSIGSVLYVQLDSYEMFIEKISRLACCRGALQHTRYPGSCSSVQIYSHFSLTAKPLTSETFEHLKKMRGRLLDVYTVQLAPTALPKLGNIFKKEEDSTSSPKLDKADSTANKVDVDHTDSPSIASNQSRRLDIRVRCRDNRVANVFLVGPFKFFKGDVEQVFFASEPSLKTSSTSLPMEIWGNGTVEPLDELSFETLLSYSEDILKTLEIRLSQNEPPTFKTIELRCSTRRTIDVPVVNSFAEFKKHVDSLLIAYEPLLKGKKEDVAVVIHWPSDAQSLILTEPFYAHISRLYSQNELDTLYLKLLQPPVPSFPLPVLNSAPLSIRLQLRGGPIANIPLNVDFDTFKRNIKETLIANDSKLKNDKLSVLLSDGRGGTALLDEFMFKCLTASNQVNLNELTLIGDESDIQPLFPLISPKSNKVNEADPIAPPPPVALPPISEKCDDDFDFVAELSEFVGFRRIVPSLKDAVSNAKRATVKIIFPPAQERTTPIESGLNFAFGLSFGLLLAFVATKLLVVDCQGQHSAVIKTGFLKFASLSFAITSIILFACLGTITRFRKSVERNADKMVSEADVNKGTKME